MYNNVVQLSVWICPFKFVSCPYYRKIVQQLRQNGRRVAVTATTGMAANMIAGETLHHWCGIGDLRHTDTALLSALHHTEVERRIRETDVLLIDEVGMLSATTFNTVEYICRNVRQVDKVFGGIQVRLCKGNRECIILYIRHINRNNSVAV